MATELRTLDINPTPFFVPPKTAGDPDFDGHGPQVHVSASLSIENSRDLWATVHMHAKETQPDWTEVEGSASYLIYSVPPQTPITRIVSKSQSSSSYTDINHDTDYLDMPVGELVRQFECIGDTYGDEAGTKTSVRVHFNPIQIEVEVDDPKVHTIQVSPTPKFVPSHVGGDLDFDGHGPKVDMGARIFLNPQNNTQIMAYLWMHAKETTPDWTEVKGWTEYVIYQHDRPISAILSSVYSQHSYTDTNHDDDVFPLGFDELVERFVCTGDTDGNEAGTRTGMTVYFHPISFREQ